MTLTVCVGASGSGKTTFLNDVHKSHKCTYIRQYHSMRPYITVSKIPNFDPTTLPYWDVYVNEGKADTIKVGGTMAGEFTAGLSGGQRKLLLFELIYQRTLNQSELLICLDEPFAGVTDDFVPFIVERLNEIRECHNILLVTNDHVKTLTSMSDNTITVSAIDRSTIQVNNHEKVDRDKAMLALSLGDDYVYTTTNEDLQFFWDVEVRRNGALLGIFIFTSISFALFLATFWNSNEDSAALVIVAGGIVAYFCVNPYLLSLVDWRNFMTEEAEALMHSSKSMNKALKSTLVTLLILIISLIEYGCVNAVIKGLESPYYLAAMFFDSGSMTFPLLCFGLYSKLPFQAVEILGSMPFLMMIFFSTTFSPGAGIEFFKEFRYLFSRFYFWCKVPNVDELMEGCPADDINILYLILSGLLGLFLFICLKIVMMFRSRGQSAKEEVRRASFHDKEFHALQRELYGEKAYRKFLHLNSTAKISIMESNGDYEYEEELQEYSDDSNENLVGEVEYDEDYEGEDSEEDGEEYPEYEEEDVFYESSLHMIKEDEPLQEEKPDDIIDEPKTTEMVNGETRD